MDQTSKDTVYNCFLKKFTVKLLYKEVWTHSTQVDPAKLNTLKELIAGPDYKDNMQKIIRTIYEFAFMTYAGAHPSHTNWHPHQKCDKMIITCQTCPGVRSRTTRWGSWPPRPWWRFSPRRSRRWSVPPWSPWLVFTWSTNIICDLDKYILQFWQIQFAISTNIICNLDKYDFQIETLTLCESGAEKVGGTRKRLSWLPHHHWPDHLWQACRVCLKYNLQFRKIQLQFGQI